MCLLAHTKEKLLHNKYLTQMFSVYLVLPCLLSLIAYQINYNKCQIAYPLLQVLQRHRFITDLTNKIDLSAIVGDYNY